MAEAGQRSRRGVELEVRYANITITEGIGARQYGIGMVSASICRGGSGDQCTVVPIGTCGVTLLLPSVLGRDGVTQIRSD